MRFSRWTLWGVSGWGVSVAFAFAAPQAQVFPLSMIDTRPFVAVEIDGQGPFSFILDTGSSSSTVSTTLATRLKLVPSGAETGTGAGEQQLALTDVHLDDLSVGPFSLGVLNIPAMDTAELDRAIGFQHFDGVLGVEIFRDHVVTLNAARGQLSIQGENQFRPALNAVPIPFTLDENNTPVVKASVAGITAPFQIDTGDRFGLTLFGAFWRAYKINRKIGTSVEAMTGYGGGGPIRGIVGRTTGFTLGNFRLPSSVTRLSLQKAGAFHRTDRAGSIGMGILRRFVVSFDYGRRVMWLSKGPDFDAPDLYDRSGMWLGLSPDGKLQVMDVVAKGPAARAGIRIGDIVTRVGDIPADADKLFDIRAMLQDPRTSAVSLSVSRAGGARRMSLFLQDLISTG